MRLKIFQERLSIDAPTFTASGSDVAAKNNGIVCTGKTEFRVKYFGCSRDYHSFFHFTLVLWGRQENGKIQLFLHTRSQQI